MKDTESQQAVSAGEPPSGSRLVRTIRHGDTTYDVFVGPCKECGTHTAFHIMRSSSDYSFSIYQISEEDYDNVEQYILELHSTFAFDVETKLFALLRAVQEFNAKGYFEAAGVPPFRVRMVDKARLIFNRFSKVGLIEHIVAHADDADDDLASAFLLGCLATENHWIELHHDAVVEGYAHIEGREAGRPLALAARIRQGKRTRTAVIRAVRDLYARDPALRRNDSKTANQIVGMHLSGFKKKDGTFLGADAIVKHIRAAREQNRL
jgi:hypothetical protein